MIVFFPRFCVNKNIGDLFFCSRAVNVDSVRIIFPYKHRFAESVQGDFVSLFKWIKLVHHIKKKPFTAESPLPSDLHIKVYCCWLIVGSYLKFITNVSF